MKSQEERLELLHKRAAELQVKKQRNQTTLWGSLSAGLCALLTIVIMQTGGTLHHTAQTNMQGSSLLNTDAGVYIMAAVIAFAAGAIITILIMKSKIRSNT